jgi:DNA recombination-dependent growth factor C
MEKIYLTIHVETKYLNSPIFNTHTQTRCKKIRKKAKRRKSKKKKKKKIKKI